MKHTITEIDSIKPSPVVFSICTLVSNKKEYEEMLDSFKEAGFEDSFCEFIYADNSQGNKYEAFGAIRKFLEVSRGQYIIICHQDILLTDDKAPDLQKKIDGMNEIDPTWAILGNAGGVTIKKNVYWIKYSDGKTVRKGTFPERVETLDENFLIIKKSAQLSISSDLQGFHLYGTDLCTIARILGYRCYVIDFMLTHKSYGNPDQSFYKVKNDLIRKYLRAFQGTYLRTTITILYLSGSRWKSYLCNRKWVISLAKFLHKAKKQLNIY